MSKYSNVKTIVDGIKFDSKLEAKRYGELRLLEKAREIRELTLQERYPLLVNGVIIGSYVCDFRYVDKNGHPVVEDCKGIPTPIYRWKKKHLKAQYGIDIVEIRK